jgi:hypothetical protein
MDDEDVSIVERCDDKPIEVILIMTHPKIGDTQIDKDKSEWVVVGVTHLGLSRVRKDSLAHKIHAPYLSPTTSIETRTTFACKPCECGGICDDCN